jgi:hypothetical protein
MIGGQRTGPYPLLQRTARGLFDEPIQAACAARGCKAVRASKTLPEKLECAMNEVSAGSRVNAGPWRLEHRAS